MKNIARGEDSQGEGAWGRGVWVLALQQRKKRIRKRNNKVVQTPGTGGGGWEW